MWPWNSVFKKFLAQKSLKWQRHRCVSFVPQKVWDLLDYQHLQINRFHQKIFLVFIVFLKKKKKKKIRCSDNRNLTFIHGSCSAEMAWRPSLPQSLAVPNVSPSLTKVKGSLPFIMVLVLLFLLQWEIFLHDHAPSRGEGRETMKEVKTFLRFWWLAFCHLHVTSLAYVGLSLFWGRGVGGISAVILRSHDVTLTSK